MGRGIFEQFASQLMRAGLLENQHGRCCPMAAFESLFPAFKLRIALLLIGVLWIRFFTGEFAEAIEPFATDTASSRETQADAIRRIPMQQLNRESQALVSDVIDKPSFFRRMPTQNIDCDPQMFQHLVRYPEVLVNIWDVMGITKVQINRTGPYTFTADDGVGTTCKCDLVFANDTVHVYYGTGAYKGNMAPRQITGRCVCVLYSNAALSTANRPTIRGSMDVFLKLDNLGADLLTRTLSPLVGKTADYNFVESARFLEQISLVCERNPTGAQILASKLTKVQPPVRDEFARIALRISESANGELEQMASIGPNSGRFTSVRGTASSSQSAQGRISDPITLDPVRELAHQSNSQRVPAMTLSDSSNVAKTPTFQAPSQLSPAPIAPAKPNIYMRR